MIIKIVKMQLTISLSKNHLLSLILFKRPGKFEQAHMCFFTGILHKIITKFGI